MSVEDRFREAPVDIGLDVADQPRPTTYRPLNRDCPVSGRRRVQTQSPDQRAVEVQTPVPPDSKASVKM